MSIATLRDAAETLIEEIQENPEESAKDILVTLMLLLVVAFPVRKGITKVLGKVPGSTRSPIADLRDALI